MVAVGEIGNVGNLEKTGQQDRKGSYNPLQMSDQGQSSTLQDIHSNNTRDNQSPQDEWAK